MRECLEISAPHDLSRIRWIVWKGAAGVWCDDFLTQESYGPARMPQVLADIMQMVTIEQLANIEAIPEELVPSFDDLIGKPGIG